MCRFLGFPLALSPGPGPSPIDRCNEFFPQLHFCLGYFSLFAASEIFRRGVKNAVNVGRNTSVWTNFVIASVQLAACSINVTMMIISLCGTVPRNEHIVMYYIHSIGLI